MKMNSSKKYFSQLKMFYLFFLILISFSFLISGCSSNKKDSVCFEKKCFDVEKVSSFAEREKGLMFRESLDVNNGMLFIFDKEDIYAFWMKNTLIPLDMIWINSSNEVVFVYENATPCGENECPPIPPDKKAIYVLEINAGLAEKYSIKSGDKVKIY
jgi:uncharacterized protein